MVLCLFEGLTDTYSVFPKLDNIMFCFKIVTQRLIPNKFVIWFL
jgi:hypothetical protein